MKPYRKGNIYHTIMVILSFALYVNSFAFSELLINIPKFKKALNVKTPRLGALLIMSMFSMFLLMSPTFVSGTFSKIVFLNCLSL